MAESQGYKLDHCRRNCPKATRDWSELYPALIDMLNKLNLLSTLEERFQTVHYHHIPKIVIAGCPNGCSQPQIKDIGICGYVTPEITENPCYECGRCIDSCLENALSWKNGQVCLEPTLCISCGDCIRACPSGRITSGESGWVFYLGGRLGRHPRLGIITGREHHDEAVVRRIRKILMEYIENGVSEERLTRFLDRRFS